MADIKIGDLPLKAVPDGTEDLIMQDTGNGVTRRITVDDLIRAATPVLLDFNVVINGKFSQDADWTKGTGWTIAAGVATKSAGAASNLTSSESAPTGKSYVYTFTLSNRTAGQFTPTVGNANGTARSADGTYTETLSPTSASETISMFCNSTGAGDVDDISVRESTSSLPQGFRPNKVWAGGILQTEGTDYDVTLVGGIYGVSFFIEPATNVQVEGVLA